MCLLLYNIHLKSGNIHISRMSGIEIWMGTSFAFPTFSFLGNLSTNQTWRNVTGKQGGTAIHSL